MERTAPDSSGSDHQIQDSLREQQTTEPTPVEIWAWKWCDIMSSNSEIDCSCHVDHFAVVILNGTIFSMCKHSTYPEWSGRHRESWRGQIPC